MHHFLNLKIELILALTIVGFLSMLSFALTSESGQERYNQRMEEKCHSVWFDHETKYQNSNCYIKVNDKWYPEKTLKVNL